MADVTRPLYYSILCSPVSILISTGPWHTCAEERTHRITSLVHISLGFDDIWHIDLWMRIIAILW